RRVVELDPRNSVAWRALADLAVSLGDVQDALSHFRELLGIEPGNDDVLRRVAELESLAGVAEPTASWDESASHEGFEVTGAGDDAGGADEPGATGALEAESSGDEGG